MRLASLLSCLLLLPATGWAEGSRGDPPPAQAQQQPLTVEAFPTGKWPEGLHVAAGSVWVAESGVRSVGRFDAANGRRSQTVKVGRLPVRVAAGPNDAVVVQVSTDKRIKRIDPKTGRVSALATLPDGPEDMVVQDDRAYVLLWKHDSSVGSSVFRVDLKTKATKRSEDTGKSAWSLTVGGGRVWVGRARGGLVALDAETLAIETRIALPAGASEVAYGAGAVFAAGGAEVARVADGAVTHRVGLSGPIAALGAWDDVVIAMTRGGALWLLDPADLAARAHRVPDAPFQPKGMARAGDTLWVTHHAGKEGGVLLRIGLK